MIQYVNWDSMSFSYGRGVGGMGVVHILWHIIENELCFVCIFYVCIVMFTIIDVNIFCDFGHCGTGAGGRWEGEGDRGCTYTIRKYSRHVDILMYVFVCK